MGRKYIYTTQWILLYRFQYLHNSNKPITVDIESELRTWFAFRPMALAHEMLKSCIADHIGMLQRQKRKIVLNFLNCILQDK